MACPALTFTPFLYIPPCLNEIRSGEYKLQCVREEMQWARILVVIYTGARRATVNVVITAIYRLIRYREEIRDFVSNFVD